jgi:hypothetical protein
MESCVPSDIAMPARERRNPMSGPPHPWSEPDPEHPREPYPEPKKKEDEEEKKEE